MKKKVFMFAGQGSQYFQMGKELYKNEAVFRKWMNELDEIPKRVIGKSIIDIIYQPGKGKEEIFDRTLYSHPAIFMVEYSLAKSLLALGVEPDYVLGTSLGEFTAAAIAGVFDVQKTLELIIFQATCFERICAQGRMLAVLDNHTHYENCSVLVNNSSLVAVNFENHFVISGFVNNLQLIENYFKEKRILCQRLPVSFGFHSANIDPARELFIKQKIISSFQIPNIKNISSFNKKQIQNIDINHLWNVVREPILFRETIIELVNKNPQLRFIDLSPSGTLATFLKYILGNNSKNCEIMPTMTLFDNELQNVSILKTVNT